MTAFPRIEILQTIIDKINAKTYLEIGVFSGKTFLSINAKRKIAVDTKFRLSFQEVPNTEYFEMTSDQFFVDHADTFSDHKIDVAFIDGLHTYEQSLKDIKNCLRYLNNGGVIVMHDCNPPTESAAVPSIEIFYENCLTPHDSWCGEVWKTITHLRSLRDDLKIFVIDCDFGLGIITQEKPENMLPYSISEIQQMTYKDLNENRVKMLNLKKREYLQHFFGVR